MYSLLECGSEDIIGRNIQASILPERLVEIFSLAIKRRTKIENEEVQIEEKKEDEETRDLFKGFAHVFPIRGKESSLDYYLMVLSREVLS